MVRERVERGEVPPAQPQNSLSVAELRQLISLMNGSEINEITIEHEASGLKLVLRKPEQTVVAAGETFASDGEIGDPVDAAPVKEAPRPADVRAQLVGIFRAALKSGGKPLVQVGDVVREGQVVGAIESLNVLNEIEARHAGRVQDILVSDGQAVEYNQVLLVVEPLVHP